MISFQSNYQFCKWEEKTKVGAYIVDLIRLRFKQAKERREFSFRLAATIEGRFLPLIFFMERGFAHFCKKKVDRRSGRAV